MAEEHLTTTPERPEAPKNGGKLKPQDFSSEIYSQIDQLISLAELLRLMEDTGSGAGKRNGFFYGIADIIEGCADRAKSMIDETYDYMYDLGEMRALEKLIRKIEGEATILRGAARELEEMADHIVKLRQDPEFDFDLQAQIFINGVRGLRKYLEDFFKHVGVLQGDHKKPQAAKGREAA